MQEKALFCKESLIQYMIDYLEKKIDKEEFYDGSEKCYSMYGDLLEKYYPNFKKIFFETVPDLCLYYIEEPGLDDAMKDEFFRKGINDVYSKLIDL